MKLFVVVANNHDYDAMAEWVVGVFSTYEKAEAAGNHDRKRYKRNGINEIL